MAKKYNPLVKMGFETVSEDGAENIQTLLWNEGEQKPLIDADCFIGHLMEGKNHVLQFFESEGSTICKISIQNWAENYSFDGPVSFIKTHTDKIYICHQLSYDNPASKLIRFNASDLSYDSSFNEIEFDSSIEDILFLEDNSKIIVGYFSSYIKRFNSDWTEDLEFSLVLPGSAKGIIQISDKFIIGGVVDGISTGYFKRFNSDWTEDNTLILPILPGDTPFLNRSIDYLYKQSDGKILIGTYGQFSYLHRLNADLTFDNTFPVLSNLGSIYTVIFLQNGKYLVISDGSNIIFNSDWSLYSTIILPGEPCLTAIEIDTDFLIGGFIQTDWIIRTDLDFIPKESTGLTTQISYFQYLENLISNNSGSEEPIIPLG
jgi:hypothetical protein